ncbi:MAG: helix-turn-helix transcriptional regulator [Desulfohalobiaceae bacterium]|nr:helix-turn-helix transcriptional regulator [Desulfohalobiaceae bacterium]
MIHVPKIEAHPLKSALRSRGVRQIEAARILGVSVSTLSHLLNGYRPIPPDMQERLERIQKSLEKGDTNDS